MQKSLQERKAVVTPIKGNKNPWIEENATSTLRKDATAPGVIPGNFHPALISAHVLSAGSESGGGFDSLKPRAPPFCLLPTKGIADVPLQLPHNGSPPNARALPRRMSAVPMGATHALESGAAATQICRCPSESCASTCGGQGRKPACCMRKGFQHKKGTQRKRGSGKGRGGGTIRDAMA